MKNHLNIKYRNPGKLKPYERNARTHSPHQIEQIANSIQAFGFNVPVLINKDSELIAGHGRVLAAISLGLTSVPTILIDHLSNEDRRAYILADNRLAENAGRDDQLLKLELSDLAIECCDVDLSLTGFEAAEIDLILGTPNDSSQTKEPAEDVSPDFNTPSTARIGDIWVLGSHQILCGDCRDPKNWQRLMSDKRARMGFTDPPYNVKIDGHVSGKGKQKHREFALASGEMSKLEFTSFLAMSHQAMADVSLDGSLHYICMDWRHMAELLSVGETLYDELKNICVWAKTNAGMGSLYRSRHEMIAVYKKGRAPHINNVQLGKYGRNRSNVWSYPGANTFSKTRDQDLADHPTVKPVELVKDAILDATHISDIVIDGFLGSGTTLLSAEATRRICYGMEIDPAYVDVVLRRFQERTGIEPTLLDTGEPLSEVRAKRVIEPAMTEASS